MTNSVKMIIASTNTASRYCATEKQLGKKKIFQDFLVSCRQYSGHKWVNGSVNL